MTQRTSDLVDVNDALPARHNAKLWTGNLRQGRLPASGGDPPLAETELVKPMLPQIFGGPAVSAGLLTFETLQRSCNENYGGRQRIRTSDLHNVNVTL